MSFLLQFALCKVGHFKIMLEVWNNNGSKVEMHFPCKFCKTWSRKSHLGGLRSEWSILRYSCQCKFCCFTTVSGLNFLESRTSYSVFQVLFFKFPTVLTLIPTWRFTFASYWICLVAKTKCHQFQSNSVLRALHGTIQSGSSYPSFHSVDARTFKTEQITSQTDP